MIKIPEIERFLKLITLGENSCLIWIGAKNSSGSGQFLTGSFKNRTAKVVCAHRWFYNYLIKVIPTSTRFIKTCNSLLCVNPWHWKVVIKKDMSLARKLRRKTDKGYAIKCNLRSRLYFALLSKKSTKYYKTLDLVGCSIEQLKKHLESKFYPNKKTSEEMSWDNYGYYGWHIDHIKSCNSFDLTKEEQQKECFHYTNLQPLWMNDNFSKGEF